MSVEHTARTGADKGLLHDRSGGRLLDDECRLAQRVDQFALQNVSTVTTCAAVLEAIGAAAPA